MTVTFIAFCDFRVSGILPYLRISIQLNSNLSKKDKRQDRTSNNSVSHPHGYSQNALKSAYDKKIIFLSSDHLKLSSK
jgi:hypothetical protein